MRLKFDEHMRVRNKIKLSVEVSAQMECSMQEAAEMICAILSSSSSKNYTDIESSLIDESSNQKKL